MKCGIVDMSTVAANGGRLDAEFYLNPTGQIDTDIAKAELNIKREQEKLEGLKAKRKTAMQVFRERVKPHLRDITGATDPQE